MREQGAGEISSLSIMENSLNIYTFADPATDIIGDDLRIKWCFIPNNYGAVFNEMKHMDFVEPYLKSLFGFLGFTDIEYYTIEGASMLSPTALEEKKLKASKGF